MKTYLYNRVSSGKQSKKDGLKRQSESTEVFDFIKKHKLQVVKQMDYIGSSFAGKNFDSETVLGKFVEAVKTGTIATPVDKCWKTFTGYLICIWRGAVVSALQRFLTPKEKTLWGFPERIQPIKRAEHTGLIRRSGMF